MDRSDGSVSQLSVLCGRHEIGTVSTISHLADECLSGIFDGVVPVQQVYMRLEDALGRAIGVPAVKR